MSLQKYNHIVKETDKAYLVDMNDVQYWIPKAACHIDKEKSEILIQDWFAKNMDDAGALFSDDKAHRLVLWRTWQPKGHIALCIGLNPSTAHHYKNDPTITKLIHHLAKAGYGGFIMVNLYTIISSSPEVLLRPDVQGDLKHDMGIIFGYSLNVKDVIFCWGTFDEARDRAKKVTDWFSNGLCFGVNKDGSPWHPMYLMYSGLKPGEARLFKYSEHRYDQNVYGRKVKDKHRKVKKYEYNAKQIQLIPEEPVLNNPVVVRVDDPPPF